MRKGTWILRIKRSHGAVSGRVLEIDCTGMAVFTNTRASKKQTDDWSRSGDLGRIINESGDVECTG